MAETKRKTCIQPRKLANKNGDLRYNWKVASFARLTEVLYSGAGEVQVDLQGTYDEQKRPLIAAKIDGIVELECQTTFEPISHKIEANVVYCAVAKEEQLANVSEDYEAILMDDGFVDIKEIIEDELILLVPLVANKSGDDLGDKPMTFGQLPEIANVKTSPFDVLKDIKNS